ncbi:heavy-metal-associated domain-containing protein [Streptomyces sp.]|uniref:heavy-metal-associated domain-containing protein n=1 Tax=Streptomyces sp. TaxID=1931 RepID=UPI002F42C5AF
MSCCSPEGHCSSAETAAVPAPGTTTVYTVTGMTCGHCEKAVGTAVSALDGVTAVQVDVTAGLVTVVSTADPDDARVRDAVEDAGYELAGRATAAAH